MKRVSTGALVTLALAGSAFIVVLLALWFPVAAIVPAALLTAWVWWSAGQERRAAHKSRPCQVCAQRFRGVDMVEHYVNAHRTCDS